MEWNLNKKYFPFTISDVLGSFNQKIYPILFYTYTSIFLIFCRLRGSSTGIVQGPVLVLNLANHEAANTTMYIQVKSLATATLNYVKL